MDIETVLDRKRRRRNTEYVGIIAFQSFFAFSFLKIADIFLWLIFALSSFGLAMTLSLARENRRTQEPTDKKRIVTDAVESFALMFILVLSALISMQLGLSLVRYESYVCIVLLSYFVGSWAGELRWTRVRFPILEEFQQKNYVINLNASMIFPYNIGSIRRSFRSRDKQ
ncbi:MAG TPA: hypothetical protein VEC36_03120 [Patescibacteria group bacterium]|nr:hypothetical protein [Patescibacteria group bacterium]